MTDILDSKVCDVILHCRKYYVDMLPLQIMNLCIMYRNDYFCCVTFITSLSMKYKEINRIIKKLKEKKVEPVEDNEKSKPTDDNEKSDDE